jgi:hypothetical protein
MKKNFTLFILFIVPLVAYLFFASGINSFSKLPTLTPKIKELSDWKTIDGKEVKLKDKITVLGFGGLEILKNRGNIFNLNQKIYERYHKFKDLQFVILCPEETLEDVKKVMAAMQQTTQMEEWRFVLAPKTEIKSFFESLQLKKDVLGTDFGTDKVYLVDKQLNLRGRKLKSQKEYKEGYSTFHMSELSNEMLDDFKIVLYEYKAALKKNNNAEKSIQKIDNAKK